MLARTMLLRSILVVGLACTAPAVAAVSADEALALGTTLTPLGAEKAGNNEGTIPAWNLGHGPADAGAGVRGDPFPNERPLFSISAKNADQYDRRLTPGTKGLLLKYPGSYRLDVYPSHRTAVAPERVYEATRRNAIAARLVEGPSGLVPRDAAGGIPFPIPRVGAEAIWNHLLRWRGSSVRYHFANYMGTADGASILVNGGTFDRQNPPYLASDSAARTSGDYTVVRINTDSPPHRKGEAYVERSNFDATKDDSWVYLPGQRRVRKLPGTCCDAPLPSASGVLTFDEPDVWVGRIDRFEWTLIGKAEMYIPYNANRSLRPKVSELLMGHHLNPDYVRWELHRVWIVEANLSPGKRHAMSRSRYYLDEDTWIAVLADRFAANGDLVKTLWTLPLVLPDVPAVAAAMSGGHDFLSGAWVAMAVLNDRPAPYQIMPALADAHFSGDALAGEGIR